MDEIYAWTVEPIPGLGDHFEFIAMPWGPMNSGKTFQRGIDLVLREEPVLKGDGCDAYQDDIIFDADDEATGAARLREVLERLWRHKLPPKWDKCELFREELV